MEKALTQSYGARNTMHQFRRLVFAGVFQKERIITINQSMMGTGNEAAAMPRMTDPLMPLDKYIIHLVPKSKYK
jgi:hypothetical protein